MAEFGTELKCILFATVASFTSDLLKCGAFLPLDLLVIAFSPEFLDIFLAVPLLCLTLLLKYLYRFIKSLNSRPFHLDFLEAEAHYYCMLLKYSSRILDSALNSTHL